MGKHSSGVVKEPTGPGTHGTGVTQCRCGELAAGLHYQHETRTWVWFCSRCGTQEARAE